MKVTIELAIFDLKFVISMLKLVCSQNFRNFRDLKKKKFYPNLRGQSRTSAKK
jgi:hypothetical protein